MPELIDKENRIAQESNEMLLRIFVSAIGYDYIAHHEKHTAQIHPDFSEDTVKLWKEIESRLKAPTCLAFDIDKAYEMLKEEIDKQLLKEAIKILTGREKMIIRLRFGLDGSEQEKTQKEVADMMGISQSYISRLEKKIMKRLYKEMKRLL